MAALSKKDQLRRFKVENLQGLSERKHGGKGSFGAVYEVTVDGVPRIAKRLHDILLTPDIHTSETERIRERFYGECYLLSKLNHPNIVGFVGVYFEEVNYADVALIMESLHTDLQHFFDPDEHPHIPVSIKLSILLDVSAGLLYLHTQLEPLIHRDLKPENVLLTMDVRAKIADLGVSKLLTNYPHRGTIQTKCPGSLAYMPPEALCEDPKYDTCLDIFPFGQLALYTAVQQFPQVFDVINHPKMTSAHRIGELEILRRKKWIDKLPQDHCLRKVILQCLKDKALERQTTQQLNREMKILCVKNPKLLDDVILVWGDKTKVYS